MAILKIMLFCLWLVILPFLNGLFLAERQKTYTGSLFQAFFYGVIFNLAVFEILAVPMVFLKGTLRQLCSLWAALILIMTVFSFVKCALPLCRQKTGRHLKQRIKSRFTPMLAVAVVCIFLQAAYVTLNQHIDDDDAYYVATAVTAVETDTLMEYNPYTGNLYNKLPGRYALSAWPLYLAALSVLSGGLHPTLIAHFLLPGLIVLFAYLIYTLIARELFPDDCRRQDFFLLLVILLLSFSGFSIYSSGTFLFIRGWQGKALVAGISIPALFYLCRLAMMADDGLYAWLSLFCAVTATCMFSSMGVVLSVISVAAYTLVYGIEKRKWSHLSCALLSCGSAFLCGVVYLIIS
ncbi:MAG: DUF6077 domain-containing protein [Lachnospiraceae bacterium]|nr:DUF6077 domain-containing protein [Lachnospiraceae bacterium]